MMDALAAVPKYDAYKESGVEWLGKIPSSWELVSLKRLLQFHTGGTPSSGNQQFYDGDLPWITIADLNGKYTDKSHFLSRLGVRQARIPLTPKGSLLYSFKLSIGQVAFASTDLYTNEAIASFVPSIGLNLRYYFYALPICLENNAATNIYGAKLLNQDLIKNATILKVCPIEQSIIANFLDQKTEQIDEAISIKQRQISLLKERKQIIIQKAVTQGLAPDVPMKETGFDWIGMIPEKWDVESFKYILVERNRKNDPIESIERLSLSIDKGITLYSEKTTNLDRFKDDFSQYKLAYQGDLVFNSMNMIVGAVGVSNHFGCVSPVYYTYFSRSEESRVTKYYEYFFKSRIVQSHLYCLGKGIMAIDRGEGKFNTVRLKVSRDDLRSMKVPSPPISEISEIVDFIEMESSKISKAIILQEQQIDKLKEYKATLINGAVTGKIKVA